MWTTVANALVQPAHLHNDFADALHICYSHDGLIAVTLWVCNTADTDSVISCREHLAKTTRCHNGHAVIALCILLQGRM